MLSRLSIRNYAIIDQLEIEFSPKLNIITGETGAGKSIILGALGLILGQRADSSVLRNRELKCVVEGFFAAGGQRPAVVAFLEENELDQLDELVVRREIVPSGKSRAFINDTPVNLSQLNQLSSLLVDLHQQFDTLDLGQSDFQRDVLDALAGNFPSLKTYRNFHSSWQQAKNELEQLRDQKKNFERELDFHQFQFNELEEAGFRENELEEIEQELKLLTNAEGIFQSLEAAAFDLSEGEKPVVVTLKQVLSRLQAYRDLLPGLPEAYDRLQSSYIELQDLASELASLKDNVQLDPAAVEKLNDRMAMGYRLLKKHGVKTTAELLAIKNDLEGRLQAVLNIDETISGLETACNRQMAELEKQAAVISGKRVAQVKPFEKLVNEMLARVGMPGARLKVEVEEKEIGADGKDAISFLFDANKSNQFQPLRKVASGGELSRLMLCIKSLVARSMDLPTLIFDEIDTGISGEAARQVGAIMKELAASRQVLCITHQPQIAGRADAHYLVYKAIQNDAVTTGVRLLQTEERIAVIAKMLGGEKPTAAAIENAREMISN